MDEQISVRSVTGVDLTLNIAGPGTRSYAFVIDWHVRLLLSGAWLILAAYVLKLSLSARSPGALFSLVPAAVIYFLYHPILEVAMRGRTPGKRVAGVRVVTRSGGAPSRGRGRARGKIPRRRRPPRRSRAASASDQRHCAPSRAMPRRGR